MNFQIREFKPVIMVLTRQGCKLLGTSPQRKRQTKISAFFSIRTKRGKGKPTVDTDPLDNPDVPTSYTNNLDWSIDYSWGKLEMQTNERALNLAMEIAQAESLEYRTLGNDIGDTSVNIEWEIGQAVELELPETWKNMV